MSLNIFEFTLFTCILLYKVKCEDIPGNLTDFSVCKVSHLGIEYTGETSRTESGVRCQSWSANTPHQVSDAIHDEAFPSGSRKGAKNYCRNPNDNPLGPWCYSMNLDLIDETCGIPLCSFSQCRFSGPGMEYGGQHNKGSSDRKCLKWNKDRKKVKHRDSYVKIDKFPKISFPELNVGDARKYCRNPDGDLGGPWCFVENEDTYEIEKEYCDIPFCDDPDCLVFTKNDETYTHYTDFNSSITNLTFGLKIWSSDDFRNASARLVLSLFALPLEGKEIEELGIGVEILISNKHTALTFGNKDSVEYEDTRGILKSTQYAMFSLTWSSGFITLQKLGQIKPVFLAEMKTKNNLLGFKKDKFNFYAAQGTNILWTFPSCKDDFFCDVQTTTGKNFQQFWMLQEKTPGHDFHFYLRAFHSACILFLQSPTVEYPRVTILLQGTDSFTKVTTVQYEGGPTTSIKEIPLPELLDYWEWREFSLTFFADTLQFHWMKSTGNHMLFELKHDVFQIMRWFSVSSLDSVAHWTFFCIPPEAFSPPPAFIPECALNKEEPDYHGTQDVTNEGLPCLPWAGTGIVPSEAKDYFPEKSAQSAWNYCRDPKNEHVGTFCYTMSSEKKVEKTYCKLRKCKSAECRMAGTGNDYIGTVTSTRSNRTCGYWASNSSVHVVDSRYKNDTLYADMSVDKARNFCRNPSRDNSGSWCYTTDKQVPRDICNIRDCDKPEECIVLVHGIPGARTYILPQWKESGIHGGLQFSLKQWNPDKVEGVVFEIYPRRGKDAIVLIIGEDNNEKIVLYHNDKMVKHKVLPHLINAGRWQDLWLQIRRGEILLGYKGVPSFLFEWINEENFTTFEPMFVSYGTLSAQTVGMFFQCDECHTEVITENSNMRTYPIGLWSETESVLYKNITLTVRGTGIMMVRLMTFPGITDEFQIVLDTVINEISFVDFVNGTGQTVWRNKVNVALLGVSYWTVYRIHFTENQFTISRNNKILAGYKSSKPLLFYWFRIGSEKGQLTWSANCDPVDLDGPPRDGAWSAWSPWQCTVQCGGGEGFRTRTCSNPRPNIFGKLCEGSPMATGKCNDFECGDISPYTMEKIREKLQSESYSYVVDEGEKKILPNDQEMLKKISVESPEAFYEWTLNGIFIKPEKDRITFKGDDIIIERVKPEDSGIYIVMLHRINKKRLILRAISLAVKPKAVSISTRATLSVIIKCNAVILAYVYTDLSLKWKLNDVVYKDYGITMLAAVDSEKLYPINESHTGDWKCVVEQKDLRLEWITNYISIKVKKAPNMYTHLMEDELTAPLFAWLKTERNVLFAIIFIVVFVVVCVILGVMIYFKFCTLKRRKYVRNRRNKK